MLLNRLSPRATRSTPPGRSGASVGLARSAKKTGGSVWARRGEVLAVHAPGNAPGVHGLWPQALALGYRVAVRPSRREPFTAHRLVGALRHAGIRSEDGCICPPTTAEQNS